MKNRNGYVLVTCLLMLAFCTLLLASISRASVSQAIAAREAEAALRTRWGLLSITEIGRAARSNLLPRRDTDDAGKEIRVPIPSRRWQIELSGQKFEAVIQDENAKINLNFWLANTNESSTGNMIRRHAAAELPSWQERLQLELAPGGTDGSGPLRSWGQVFRPQPVSARTEHADAVRLATGRLTLWTGRGAINIRTADEDVLLDCLRLVTGGREASTIVRRRQEADINEILADLDVTDRKRDTLRRLLTDHCESYSLWLRCRSRSGDTTWFVVNESLGAGASRTRTFSW